MTTATVTVCICRSLLDPCYSSAKGTTMFPSRFKFSALTLAISAASAMAAPPDGAALYKARCATCHDNPQAQLRTPKREEVAARSPEAVLAALSTGAMVTQAAGLSDEEDRAIALYITGKAFGNTGAETMAGQCTEPLKKFAPNAKAD